MRWISDEYRHPLSWKNRGTRAVLGLVALVLVIRLGWGWYIGRQLRAELDQVRQRGWPVAVADVQLGWMEDSQNAAVLLQRASQAHVASVYSPRSSSMEYRGYPPYSQEWMQLAEASENAHGQVFALARQARSLPQAQWVRSLPSPVATVPLGYLNNVRHTANTLCDGAELKHLQGLDEEAIERLLDALHLAHSLRQDHFLVSQLVAIGIDALTFDATQTIAPGLQFVDNTPRAHMRRLIDHLLDEGPAQQGVRRALLFERAASIDTLDLQARSMWLIRPLKEQAIVRCSRNLTLAAEAGALPGWPQARAVVERGEDVKPPVVPRWPWSPPGPPQVPRYSKWFHDWSGDLSSYVDRHFRVIAERRVTAVSLAMQLYRSDHGRWPEKLDELVPNHLPALPADPFHADGRPIGYVTLKGALPDGGDRPMLYFDVGPDVSCNPPAEPCYGWYNDPSQPRRDPIRQYRDLTRFTPPKPSTSEAVDDDPEKPDTGGQQTEEDKGAQQPEQQ